MPRGYSYDHFKVPKREPRERATPPASLKAATAKKGDAVPLAESQEGLHYGQEHAETVKRSQSRASQRQAREASGAETPVRTTTRAATRKAAPTGRPRKGTPAKESTRGGKALGRVAAVAKRVSRKTVRQDTPKKR